jgi:hypothetical protein
MSTPLSPHKSYEDRRFSAQRAADLRGAQFESCTFVDIDFSQATLQGVNFQDCLFQRCDLSRAILTGAQFQEAQFESCLNFKKPICRGCALRAVICRVQTSTVQKCTGRTFRVLAVCSSTQAGVPSRTPDWT